MELALSTPSLLFPALSLLMLAYTNRFLALAKLIRDLREEYNKRPDSNIISQIKNLKLRVSLIKNMQAFGTLSIFFCVGCMFLLFMGFDTIARICFGFALILMLISMLLSLWEINLSTTALNLVISDLEEFNKSK
jgi:hypothetical protein